MAIAWMYREDYDRAGYLVLPRLLPALALIPLGLIPGFLGRAGSVYTMGTALLGSYLSYCSAQLVFRQSNRVARRLLLASIIYLPFEFVLMVLDKA